MLTAQQAAADPDVLWLQQQAVWLLVLASKTANLDTDAETLSNTTTDPNGGTYGSTVAAASSFVQTVAPAIRAGLMTGVAGSLALLLQGLPSLTATSDITWLGQQAAVFENAESQSNTLVILLATMVTDLNVPDSVRTDLEAAAAALMPSADTATRFDTIAARMKALALPTLPITVQPVSTSHTTTTTAAAGSPAVVLVSAAAIAGFAALLYTQRQKIMELVK